MRHGNVNRKFGRERNQRKALLKSLAHNLVVTGKVKTTEAKAKEIRPFVEKLITLGKRETPASKRLLEARVGKMATVKLVGPLAAQYKTRAGGYTRITKLVRRGSDGAPMAVIEFV
ncbi:50S ribosomal protein L17 [Candidatus Parcubacteria bacterium]|nr:50S ribosomal protein L17 [Candidatus Parcubacteria bacterium]